MRFIRYPRHPFTDSSRKRAALRRKQRLEREALPLFAEQIAEEQPGEDQVMQARAIRWAESQQRTRDARAARWREARRRATWMLSPSVMASHASHWHIAMPSGGGIHAINRVHGREKGARPIALHDIVIGYMGLAWNQRALASLLCAIVMLLFHCRALQ